jgi:hypothetical protein
MLKEFVAVTPLLKVQCLSVGQSVLLLMTRVLSPVQKRSQKLIRRYHVTMTEYWNLSWQRYKNILSLMKYCATYFCR